MTLKHLILTAGAACSLVSAASAQFADNCGAAPSVNEGVYSFNLSGATNDYAGTCGSTGTAADQWIRYVATGNGTATVSTCGLTGGDSVLTVLNGECGAGQIVCLDDSCDLQTSVSFPVAAGSVYMIRIAGFAGNILSGQVSISRPNDLCADATFVADGSYAFNTAGSNTDGGSACGFNTTNDLWYRYSTPGPGVLTVTTCGSANFDTVLSAFNGCGGAELACNDDTCGLQSTINVNMAANTAVLVRLAGYNGAIGSGNVRFSFNSADSCQNATVVSDGIYNYDNTNTINDGGGECFGSYDVWFNYVSPGYGWLDATTCGLTSHDSTLSAYTTCGGGAITCNDDACGGNGLQSFIATPVTPGSQTLVRVAGWAGSRGSGQVSLALRSNDNCANATPVTDGTYGYDTSNATTDGAVGCGGNGNNVWFRYNAPVLGRLNVNTCGLAEFDTVLAAFDGCGGGELACNDDAGCGWFGLNSAISFPVQAGSDTRISLGGFLGARGTGQVHFEFIPCRVDFNGDGFVDFFDYDDYVLCFESGICPPGKTADFNGDGFADFFDYDDFVAAFESGC